jgi:methionine-rich copper-binding protein CopC
MTFAVAHTQKRTRSMRIRSLLAAGAAAALLAALPAVATAHAELESSTPAAGANLDTAPTTVTLNFSEGLDPDGSSFTVKDADGHEVGSGEVDLSVADRNVMTGDVTISDPGVYTVAYEVVAEDGHASGGTISFGYNATEAIPDPTSEESPDTALPRPSLPILPTAGWLLVALAGLVGVRRLPLR